jgi:hypothetical protein
MGNHLRSWFFEILDFWGLDARCAIIEARHALFLDERRTLVRHVALLPNGRHALIRRVALFLPMGNMWVPNGRRALIRCVTLYLSQNQNWLLPLAKIVT